MWFGFVWFGYVLFRLVSFRFVQFRFVSFFMYSFVSFRFVSFVRLKPPPKPNCPLLRSRSGVAVPAQPFDLEKEAVGPNGDGASASASAGASRTELIHQISAAVYKQGRLRHTFQAFNTSRLQSALCRADFVAGMQGLGVEDQPEGSGLMVGIFDRFDKDKDGLMTYSEFVRMLATRSLA